MKINYYEVCVNTARMIDNPKATKKELERVARQMFSYTKVQFEENEFDIAFTQFNKANGAKMFRPIYA